MILIQLLHNLALLISLSIVSGFIDKRYPRTTLKGLYIQGILFGIVAIIGMLQPFIFNKGLIFDGRSVVLSIASMFFGPVTGITAGIFTLIVRYIQGGNGVVPGTLVVICSVTTGILFYNKRNKTEDIKAADLYKMGLIVHVLMILMMFSLPLSTAVKVVYDISFPVIVFYPLATVLIGKILSDQEANTRNTERIKESEARYRNVFENSLVGITMTSMNGSLRTNRAYRNILGYSEEELNKLTWMDITHPDSMETDKKVVSGILAGEQESARWKKKYIGKEGKIIWADINTVLVRDNNNAPLYFVTAIYDISEQVQAEKALKEGEEKYRYMFANNPQPMWIYDLDTLEFLEVNNSAIKHYGYTREEFLSMTLKDIRPAEDLTEFMKDIERTRKGFNDPHEWRHLKKNGEILIVEIVSLPILYNGRKAKHVMINDITEKKHAEEELKKLSLAVEYSPALVVITNKNGKIEYVNKKVFDITGYTKEEVIGKNPRIWNSGFHDTEFYKELWDTILSGRMFRSEMLNKKKNGDLYWESALISSLLDKNGDISHFVSVNEDITDQKRMIEELITAKDNAEQSAKLKSEFLAQMSHEIRTPLNAIVGIVHYLKDIFLKHVDLETAHWFERLDISSERIIRTVELILNAAELQTGGYKTRPAKLNLDIDILYKLYKEFEHSANQKGLELLYNNSEPDITVISDEFCLKQIFANLIGNAVKYTEKGKIEIFVGRNNAGKLITEIRDSGIGISQEFLSRIFEPFTQEEQGYSRSFQGNGLGLALVKKYCDLNNLSIEIESKKDIGSVFRVIFN